MQRSKQYALMFLLGALVAGGALGFTAARLINPRADLVRANDRRAMRREFAEELGLDATQRAQLDTILETRHRQMDSVIRPIRPQLDAVSDSARAQMLRMFTPAQRSKFEEMHRALKARESKESRK